MSDQGKWCVQRCIIYFYKLKKKLIINRNSGDKIQMSNRYRQEFN